MAPTNTTRLIGLPLPTATEAASDRAVLIGAVAGAAAGLLLIGAAGVAWILRSHRQRNSNSVTHEEDVLQPPPPELVVTEYQLVPAQLLNEYDSGNLPVLPATRAVRAEYADLTAILDGGEQQQHQT